MPFKMIMMLKWSILPVCACIMYVNECVCKLCTYQNAYTSGLWNIQGDLKLRKMI